MLEDRLSSWRVATRRSICSRSTISPAEPEDIVTIHTGGGGGFGNPWERDPEGVRQDVMAGYVTLECAERDYGVVLTDELEIEVHATHRRREEKENAAL
jgi:N-methylhydantoinase B/oxoprolinase/acetone carboxylase alpha subunit